MTDNRISLTRKTAVTGVLSALSFTLMLLEFSVPLMPEFIKLDFSDLPALIGAFAMGPVCGVVINLVKNLLHLFVTTTAGIGELSNFLLGCAFILPAGMLYRAKMTRSGAVMAAVLGSLTMALFCVASNRLLIYPMYGAVLGLDNELILDMYRTVLPSVSELTVAILIFNAPFTLFKGLLDSLITLLIYKKLSPILKGRRKSCHAK